MPAISERRIKMVNPGKRRGKPRNRNMSLKQLLHFGTKRQRTSAKARLHKPRTKRKVNVARTRRARSVYKRKRKPNVRTIVTVLPVGTVVGNPGRKRRRSNKSKMARATKKQLSALRKARAARRRNLKGNPGRKHRRRSTPVARRRRRHSNVVYRKRIKRGIYQYSSNRGRRRNPGRRYRRNPDMGGLTSGVTGRVLGVIGGATLTKLLVGFVPAQFTGGILGYFAIGAVAVLQGKAVGKVMKNSTLGNDFLTGGLVYLAIKVLNDMVPSLGGNLGLSGGRGMGLLAPGSFYVPQVNNMNSMGTYVRPAALGPAYNPAMAAAGAGAGMGSVRRGGRIR